MTAMEPVNLLVTIDKAYLEPLRTMLQSYAQTHTDVPTNVYVAHNSLSDKNFEYLKTAVSTSPIQVIGIEIKDGRFKNMPVLERLSEVSFYRLLAFSYLPKEVKKCLYLDPDIYIRHSLLPLYSLPTGENYAAAASHIYGLNNRFNCVRLRLWRHKRYINSGVMLLNLENIRKHFSEDDIFKALRQKARRLFMGDQDLANVLFTGKILLVDELLYNLDERTYRKNKKHFSLQDVADKTAIIHYNGKYKPWLNGYKGVLDRFYPPITKVGAVKKHNAFNRLKSILLILFLNGKSKKEIINEK